MERMAQSDRRSDFCLFYVLCVLFVALLLPFAEIAGPPPVENRGAFVGKPEPTGHSGTTKTRDRQVCSLRRAAARVILASCAAMR
jgi:hypothetical protein